MREDKVVVYPMESLCFRCIQDFDQDDHLFKAYGITAVDGVQAETCSNHGLSKTIGIHDKVKSVYAKFDLLIIDEWLLRPLPENSDTEDGI